MSATDQLTRDFKLSEFAVSASNKHLVRPVPAELRPRIERLARIGLQPVRDRLKRSMTILSGYRTKELNEAVGGSDTSQHALAEAADFTCENIREAFITIAKMADGGELRGIGQIIYYPEKGFIHMALLSDRYPTATLCVHWPNKGFRYRPLTRAALFETLVPLALDPSRSA